MDGVISVTSQVTGEVTARRATGRGTSPTGHVTSQVEVGDIWPRDGRISVHGTAVGAESAAGMLIVRAREPQDGEFQLPVSTRGRRFSVGIPCRSLATACTAAEQTWDLYLLPRGQAEPVRLGRHLDDIVGKKKIFTYPAQAAEGVWLRPFYTIRDNLSIRCWRAA